MQDFLKLFLAWENKTLVFVYYSYSNTDYLDIKKKKKRDVHLVQEDAHNKIQVL